MRQAICTRCKQFAWVNVATLCRAIIGEFCGTCFETINHDDPGHAEHCAQPKTESDRPSPQEDK